MKIWIDGYEANVLQRLGSSQVAFELIRNFEKIDHQNDYTILLPNHPMEDFPKERDGWKYKILKPKRLWTKIALPLAIYTSKIKPDLIYSPTHYISRFSPTKRIATIFDLSFLHFPEMFQQKDLWQLKNGTKYSVENADYIITISNSSKKDIISEYKQSLFSDKNKIDKNRVTVAYPGFNKKLFVPVRESKKVEEVLKKYNVIGQYIIYVGTIQPRKNLIRLMEALAKIDDLNLVVVGKTKGEGKEGWMYQETLDTPRRLKIEERVKFLGYIPDEDLPCLYSGAIAFVLPSLWEGFGITVLEAMACGTPVLVSNVSSLPEVIRKAGLTFDPYSVDQIEQAIRTIVSDKKLRQKYSQEALERAKNFSWEKMTRTVLKVFEKVGEKTQPPV